MKTKISNYKSVQEQHFINETVIDSTEDEKFIVNLYIIINDLKPIDLHSLECDDFFLDIQNYNGSFSVYINENSSKQDNHILCLHTRFLDKDTCISYLKSAMIHQAERFLERAQQLKNFGISI